MASLMEDDDLDWAWAEIKTCFGLEGEVMSCKSPSDEVIAILEREEILKSTAEYLQSELNHRLRVEVVPAFWTPFRQFVETAASGAECAVPSRAAFDLFMRAVTDLYSRAAAQMAYVHKLSHLSTAPPACHMFQQESYEEMFKLMLQGTLHSQLPKDFETLVELFYSQAFHVFYVRQDKNQQDKDDSMVEFECDGCRKETEKCDCNAILSIFDDVNKKLLELDLLERLTSQVVTRIVRNRIEKHVQETCKGSFTISHIQSLEDWLDCVVMSWIRIIYMSSKHGLSVMDIKTNSSLKLFRRRLCHHLYEIYTRTRIDQLFNIIVEFPESHPALEDLRECLKKTDSRSHLTQSLKAVLIRKLLHLGVNTTDILTAYIAAIKSLRLLDPSGVVLEIVCEPVRAYLRTREDTVRSIVASLIDSRSELAEELQKNEGLTLDESFYEEEDMEDWQEWMPDPVDVTLGRKSQSRRTSDIISMLVNIYGSKELFVNEYRSLLSNRLLSHFSYDAEREIRNLELLKLRFGEAPLHQCEVMLKDIGDSKRINTLLHSEDSGSSELRDQSFPTNSIILSAQFWPQFKQDTLDLPPEVQSSLDVYTKAFEAMKGNRTLVWKTHLGFANIDIEIGGKKANFNISPVLASIIYQFQVKAEWTAGDLAHILKIPVSTLRRRIVYWQTQGVITESETDKYQLVEEGSLKQQQPVNHGGGGSNVSTVEDELESVTRTSQDQRAEELQVFWSYIENMLINLESLPLERIFQMLRLFAMQGPTASVGECDIDEVRSFLDKKVREHALCFVGGQYKLPPKN